MELRLLKYSDNYDYLSLINQFRQTNVTISDGEFKQLYDKIFSSGFIIVCEENKQLVGSISVYIEQKFIHNFAKYAHIEDVFVADTHRNRGIGLLLLDDSIVRCKELEIYKLVLHCEEKLLNYYKKRDFALGGVMMGLKIDYKI